MILVFDHWSDKQTAQLDVFQLCVLRQAVKSTAWCVISWWHPCVNKGLVR